MGVISMNSHVYVHKLCLLCVLVLGVFIRTPKITFVSTKHAVDANALLTLQIYTELTQQSAQSFRPAPSGPFDISLLVRVDIEAPFLVHLKTNNTPKVTPPPHRF